MGETFREAAVSKLEDAIAKPSPSVGAVSAQMKIPIQSSPNVKWEPHKDMWRELIRRYKEWE